MKVSTLDQHPDNVETVATMLADGATRQQIAKVFNVSVDTITNWRKRPDVQSKVAVLIRHRADSILRYTDTAIEAFLAEAKESDRTIEVELLLKIRQVFAGQGVNLNLQGNTPAAIEELIEALDEHPELAEMLGGALSSGTAEA